MASGPPAGLRVSVASLFTAYVVSFVVVGLSYVVYSRLLSPAEFGIYSAALVIANFGQVLLDGGLRNTMIKSRVALAPVEEGTLMSLMLAAAVFLSAGLLLGRLWGSPQPVATSGGAFLAAFAAVFIVAYPLIVFPTARLERAFQYRRLAWIESCGGIVERAAPVLLIVLGAGLWSFVIALVAGMALRAVALGLAAPVRPCLPTRARVLRAVPHLKEGTWFQVGVGSNLLRDGLHVLLVGPLFGAAWIGYYGWAMQLARIASQAFVQVAARVSLPLFAQSEGLPVRWSSCLRQVRLLSMATGPLLGACLIVIPSVDVVLFHGRWEPAMAILPLLFLRMIPNVATTPVGMLLLVEGGARRYTLSVSAWTALEVVGAAVLLLALGPLGLAVSMAVMAWPGLLIMTWATFGGLDGRLADLLRSLLVRPSLGITVAGVAIAQVGMGGWFLASNRGHLAALAVGAALLAAAYLSEPRLREMPGALLRTVRSSENPPPVGEGRVGGTVGQDWPAGCLAPGGPPPRPSPSEGEGEMETAARDRV